MTTVYSLLTPHVLITPSSCGNSKVQTQFSKHLTRNHSTSEETAHFFIFVAQEISFLLHCAFNEKLLFSQKLLIQYVRERN